jgi:hypothetical protein
MLNFANAKIYKLVNSEDDEIYIGSTCGTLHLRKCRHKKDANRYPNRRVYEHLNRVGWANVRIILIESFSCLNKNELLRREQYHIDLLQPSLNKNSSYVHCPHGRQHSNCILCDGSGVCLHNRRKTHCKICNAGKYKCDYCDTSYNSKQSIKYHHKTMKHKLKFISTFEEVFGEIITMTEAALMDFL